MTTSPLDIEVPQDVFDKHLDATLDYLREQELLRDDDSMTPRGVCATWVLLTRYVLAIGDARDRVPDNPLAAALYLAGVQVHRALLENVKTAINALEAGLSAAELRDENQRRVEARRTEQGSAA